MQKRFPFKPVKKTRLYEEIAEQIKQAIFTGQLEPGDRIPSERDLCKMFKVGRPTIREGLRTLNIMGLIEVNSGVKGSLVKECNLNQYMEAIREQLSFMIKIDKNTIENAWQVVKYIELGIAHSAATNATQEDLKKLGQLIKKMESCGNDIQNYFLIALEFHKELSLATKNKIFCLVWEIFHDILLKGYSPILEEIMPEGPSKLLEANKVLLNAITSKDSDKINKAIEIHAEEEKFFSYHTHRMVVN